MTNDQLCNDESTKNGPITILKINEEAPLELFSDHRTGITNLKKILSNEVQRP